MGTLATIALVVLGISFLVFVTFFGRLPALRRTPIAWLHRLLWVHLPNGLTSLDQRLTGGRVTTSCSRFGNYMMYDRHPTVLIFFLILLIGGEALYLPSAWPQLSTIHKTAGTIAMILPYLFLYLSASSDSGAITAANHVAEMARYPYDFTLFHPGATCTTCRRLKPARSKHCAVCKRCVARCDHHCIFINNCVGAANTHWFILLLLSTAVLTLYGGLLGVGLMTTQMRLRFPAWAMLPWRANGGEGMPFTQWLVVWSWGMQDAGRGAGGGVAMGAVTLLALMTSPLVWALLGYHVWLVYCGTTTNESMKWSDWQAEMDEGLAYKRKMDAGRVKDIRVEPAWTRWPVEAEQVMVRTDDGKPPGKEGWPGFGEWEAAWRLKDVENLYDLGFWDNLVDVFVPGFMFRDPHVPVGEARLRRKKKRRARKIYIA
ncbi:DHHC palmitoyltransferase-domain-containing protein [Chaetomium fimeti]|uniref:Palmitoyltransferase n=1 Tax=Chaetomium fimeti TaxID=1854472 RepID=A0AAE0H7F9_9PEZI|nr:DHHC palmitoyltransferase-domain-containing protein [Chaetomium fimeti]